MMNSSHEKTHGLTDSLPPWLNHGAELTLHLSSTRAQWLIFRDFVSIECKSSSFVHFSWIIHQHCVSHQCFSCALLSPGVELLSVWQEMKAGTSPMPPLLQTDGPFRESWDGGSLGWDRVWGISSQEQYDLFSTGRTINSAASGNIHAKQNVTTHSASFLSVCLSVNRSFQSVLIHW